MFPCSFTNATEISSSTKIVPYLVTSPTDDLSHNDAPSSRMVTEFPWDKQQSNLHSGVSFPSFVHEPMRVNSYTCTSTLSTSPFSLNVPCFHSAESLISLSSPTDSLNIMVESEAVRKDRMRGGRSRRGRSSYTSTVVGSGKLEVPDTAYPNTSSYFPGPIGKPEHADLGSSNSSGPIARDPIRLSPSTVQTFGTNAIPNLSGSSGLKSGRFSPAHLSPSQAKWA